MRPRLAVVLGLACLLSGCLHAGETSHKLAAEDEHAAKPAAWRDGFRDGCHTVMSEQCLTVQDREHRRDDARMRADRDYEIGWNDGARRCGFCATPMIIFPRR